MSPPTLASLRPAPPAERDHAGEARVSFLRLVSHELRTPLNAIIGFSELLSAQPFGPLGAPEYAEYAWIIHDSGRKMLRLVNQVLEIVRLKEGLVRLDCQAGPATFPVQEAIDLLRGDIMSKGVAVDLQEAAPQPLAYADPRALRTIAFNLVQNAVQFSPSGSSVVVAVRPEGGRVLVEVLDRGPGIDAEEIDRVLHPFEQGDHSLSRTTHGAGLGLPTALLLCERMGAKLSLCNREGEGLCATVALPAAHPREAA
jgi:signal transduction histidine kinase